MRVCRAHSCKSASWQCILEGGAQVHSLRNSLNWIELIEVHSLISMLMNWFQHQRVVRSDTKCWFERKLCNLLVLQPSTAEHANVEHCIELRMIHAWSHNLCLRTQFTTFKDVFLSQPQYTHEFSVYLQLTLPWDGIPSLLSNHVGIKSCNPI